MKFDSKVKPKRRTFENFKCRISFEHFNFEQKMKWKNKT